MTQNRKRLLKKQTEKRDMDPQISEVNRGGNRAHRVLRSVNGHVLYVLNDEKLLFRAHALFRTHPCPLPKKRPKKE